MSLTRWFRHAFAVNGTPAQPSADQLAVVEKLCHEVVRRRLTPAAVAFLEMSRPLNFLGAQTLHFFSPLISAVAQGKDHRHLAEFLERRDSIDRICQRVEELQQAADLALKDSPLNPIERAAASEPGPRTDSPSQRLP